VHRDFDTIDTLDICHVMQPQNEGNEQAAPGISAKNSSDGSLEATD